MKAVARHRFPKTMSVDASGRRKPPDWFRLAWSRRHRRATAPHSKWLSLHQTAGARWVRSDWISNAEIHRSTIGDRHEVLTKCRNRTDAVLDRQRIARNRADPDRWAGAVRRPWRFPNRSSIQKKSVRFLPGGDRQTGDSGATGIRPDFGAAVPKKDCESAHSVRGFHRRERDTSHLAR